MNSHKSILSLLGNLVLLAVVGGVMWVFISVTRQNSPKEAVATASNLGVDVTPLETPAPTEVAPYPGPLTPSPIFTPAPTWDVNFHPTMSPATPKPITYSIDSAEEWMTYVNPELGLILKYPEIPPRVDKKTDENREWQTINLFVRTGPTYPANPSNEAVIIIVVHPNPKLLPLNEAIYQIGTGYGEIKLLDKTDSLTEVLSSKAGVAEAGIVETDWGQLYAVVHGRWLYIMGGAVMTASEGQQKVLELVVSTLEFIDEK